MEHNNKLKKWVVKKLIRYVSLAVMTTIAICLTLFIIYQCFVIDRLTKRITTLEEILAGEILEDAEEEIQAAVQSIIDEYITKD